MHKLTFQRLFILVLLLLGMQNAFAAPPVLDAIATPQTIVIGDTLTFTVTATDPDGDNLTFSLENEPSGATIDANTGEFSWTPTSKGTYSATIKVDDGSPNSSDEQTVSFFVSAIRPGFNTTDFPANDDGSVAASLGFNINYFGSNYSDVYVNNNGNFTFGNSLNQFTPSPLNSAGLKIIAAFWADVDTNGNGSGIAKYATGTVDGHSAFGATWIDVGYYPSQVDKLNSFQIILVDRSDIKAGDFDIELNYSTVKWESGNASGGNDGLGGNSARVGYSDGADVNFELPGSAVNGALIDGGSNALISNSNNSEVAGRYYFPVRNGDVIPTTADLQITQSDSPDPIYTGNQITYTVTVKNLGPNDATNIKVVDTLPSGTTFVSASGTDWTCQESSGTVTCDLASLAVGVANPITIQVTAPNTVGEISNQVKVSSDMHDPDTTNNSATEKTTVELLYTPPPVQQNIPPTLEPISNKTIDTDDTLQIELNAIDPNDGDILSFSLVDAPDGASINDGVLTWKADQAGVFNFTVQVTDNGTPTLSDQKTFEVTVNKPPIYLKPIPNKIIEFGETLEVTLTATNKDGNILNDQNDFNLVDAPDGAEIEDGILTWKADQVGVFEFTVKVTDNDNSITFTVTVQPPPVNLTTEISPLNSGTIQINPNKTAYDLDDSVNLTATVKDSECYEFSHWEGDCNGSDVECNLVMDDDKKAIAHFIGKPVNLNITTQNGKVEPEKSKYLCGEKVELTATPNPNYQFLGWTGYISTKKNPISLVLKEQENNLTAIFGPATNLRIHPLKVHAKVGDELTFTASGSSNGNYFWENYQGETLKYKVTEQGIFYIWVTDGHGFAWSLVDSRSLDNAIILIRFAATNLNLFVGEKQQIAVKAYDGNGNAKNIIGDVVLESENPEIAQVMQNGQVTARGIGTTNLIATYQDKQAIMPVTITAANRVLQVEPENIILSEGDSQRVKIYEINQSGTKTLFEDAILNIRNTQFASVQNNVVTGMNKGSTWLDIISGELSLSVPVIVGFRQNLAINPSKTTIIKGGRVVFAISGGKPPYQIKANTGQILKGAGNNKFVYQSDSTGTAKVRIIDSLNEEITATININSALDSSPQIARVTSQETVTLQAIGGDENYFWTATAGQLSSLTDRRVEYTAPEKTGRYTVTVRDGLGNTKDILILVGEDLLLSQQQLFLEPDETVELNILGGESPYTVEVDAGNAEIVDSKINYKAPKVAGNYILTISDNRNNKVSAEIKVALDLLITPLSSRIDAGESLTLHAAGGFGEKRWIVTKGSLDKTNGETVTWTAPNNFGPANIYVMDAAGTTAVANLEVASKGFAVTPSVRHVFPNDNANFTAVGGATPYTWIVEQGDFNAVDDETINYQADNVRGSYKIEITDNSGKKAQAQVNVYSTKLFASPKILYINKGETLPISIGGGTGNYTITSQLGQLAQNQLKLEQDQRSITTDYTAPSTFEGQDIIHILDTAGNLASIKVEIAKKDDIINIYAGEDGKIDEAEMNLAIDDFFAGQAWLDRTIMFEIAEQFVAE
jgi:uncharacterized repeat protein (TIGR01451 family)